MPAVWLGCLCHLSAGNRRLSIGQSCLGSSPRDWRIFGPPSVGEVRAAEVHFGEVHAGEVHVGEVRAGERRAPEVRAGEGRAPEVRADEVRAPEVRASWSRLHHQQEEAVAAMVGRRGRVGPGVPPELCAVRTGALLAG